MMWFTERGSLPERPERPELLSLEGSAAYRGASADV